MKFRLANTQKNTLPGRRPIEMDNRVGLKMARNVIRSLLGVLHDIPAARARKEHAEAMKKEVEAYDCLLEFLEKAGLSRNERKAIIAKEIASKGERRNMIENLQTIADLVERQRIHFQITGEVDEPANDKDNS